MRTPLRSRTPRRGWRRVLIAASLAATLLAGCGTDGEGSSADDATPDDATAEGEDGAGDDGEADEPIPVEPDGGIGDTPEGSPGADGPADDGSGEDGPGEDGAATGDGDEPTPGEVPPLLDVIDGWPETEVTFAAAEVSFQVKVADEPERRQQGLMDVPALPDGVGMLFTFDDARTGGFWMRDTLVPLDIAYLADGEVVAILQMDPCPPDETDCEIYDPGTEYDAALEVGQGVLDEVGVTEGDTATWDPPRDLDGA
jgi:uncharacterized protein